MTVEQNPINSAVLGGNVLVLKDVLATDDLARQEAAYCQQHRPIYVSARIAAEDLPAIHLLERHGFQFVECQVRSDLTQMFVVKADRGHPYEQEVARRHDWSVFFTALEQQGFHPITHMDAGTLYRLGPNRDVHEDAGHDRD